MAPEQTTLREWMDKCTKKGKRAQSTVDLLENTASNLCTFFGDDKPIADITPGDAEDFRVWMGTEANKVTKGGLGHNTVRRRIGHAKQFFRTAVKHKKIPANPFGNEVAAVGANIERQFFVPANWIERCIKAAPCEEWRVMIALARYGGLRSHETRLQRWEDIDIPNRRMIVRSNKTPPTRACPIFPELLPHLMRAKEMAPAAAELIVTRYAPGANIGTTFEKIVTKAGLVPWPKLMQNLRATRETELLARYPNKDVSSWLGNSEPVAMRHDAMTMEDSFDRATREGAGLALVNSNQNPHHSLPLSDPQAPSTQFTLDPRSRETRKGRKRRALRLRDDWS